MGTHPTHGVDVASGHGLDAVQRLALVSPAGSLKAEDRLVGTEDRKEGVRAFNEKRKAKFLGK